jgi:hypothetical protein
MYVPLVAFAINIQQVIRPSVAGPMQRSRSQRAIINNNRVRVVQVHLCTHHVMLTNPLISHPTHHGGAEKRKPKPERDGGGGGERLGEKRPKTEPAVDHDADEKVERRLRVLHAAQQRSMLDFVRMPPVKKEEKVKEEEPPLTVIELGESPPTSPLRPATTTTTKRTPHTAPPLPPPRRSSSPSYLLLELLDDVGT